MTKITDQQAIIEGLATERDTKLKALCTGVFFSEPPQFPKTFMSSLITQTQNTVTLESINVKVEGDSRELKGELEAVDLTGAEKVKGIQGKLDAFIILKQKNLAAAQDVVDKAKFALSESQTLKKSIGKRSTIIETKIIPSETPEERSKDLQKARVARNKIRDEITAMKAAKAQLQSQATAVETEYEKNAKVEKETLTALEKEGAKALETFQQTLFKQIIEQATLAKVNAKLGAKVKEIASIATEVAGAVGDLTELRNSLTEAQTTELDATISALKEGKVGKEAIDKTALLKEIDREAEKSVQGVFNNPNYQSITNDLLQDFLKETTFRGLQGKVELKLTKAEDGEFKWKVEGIEGKGASKQGIEVLQGAVDTRLADDEKLKAKTTAFTKLVDDKVEEAQKSPTLWDQFINFINQIKQKLGFDVKLESKQEISSKQDRAARRSVGKFTKAVLQKAGSSRGVARE